MVPFLALLPFGNGGLHTVHGKGRVLPKIAEPTAAQVNEYHQWCARARAKPPECTTRAEKPNVNFIRLTCTLRSDTLQVRGRAGSALRAAQRPLRRHRQTRHFEVKKRRAVFAC